MPPTVSQTSTADIGAEAWNRLARGRTLYVTYEWIRGLDRAPATEALHLAARDANGELIGILPVYRTTGGGNPAYDHRAELVAPLGVDAAEADWYPALHGGPSGGGYANELLLAPWLAARDRRAALQALVDAFFARASREPIRSVAFMYMSRAAAEELRAVVPAEGAFVLTSADMRIPVVWSSFDEYLAGLSRNRRSSARRELKRFAAAGYRVTTERLSDCLHELAPLVAAVMRRHGAEVSDRLMAGVLREQAADLDGSSVVFAARVGPRLVAACHCYAWERGLYGRSVGFDYGRLAGGDEWPNLAVYTPLRHALEHGYDCLHLGIDSFEAKAFRGARPEPLWSYVLRLDGARPWTDALVEQRNRAQLHRLETIAALAGFELTPDAGTLRPGFGGARGRGHRGAAPR